MQRIAKSGPHYMRLLLVDILNSLSEYIKTQDYEGFHGPSHQQLVVRLLDWEFVIVRNYHPVASPRIVWTLYKRTILSVETTSAENFAFFLIHTLSYRNIFATTVPRLEEIRFCCAFPTHIRFLSTFREEDPYHWSESLDQELFLSRPRYQSGRRNTLHYIYKYICNINQTTEIIRGLSIYP